MKPIVKAADLFLSYFERLPDYLYDKSEATREAKECALIAVDEIIQECDKFFEAISVDRKLYWQEVKQEIQKL